MYTPPGNHMSESVEFKVNELQRLHNGHKIIHQEIVRIITNMAKEASKRTFLSIQTRPAG